MENKINIAEILKDFPKGMKLYSPVYDKVEFRRVNSDSIYPIMTATSIDRMGSFTSDGLLYEKYPSAECLLFPSREMRDWTKFFKRGDVVRHKDGNMYAIFEGWANDDYTKFNTTIDFYVFDASFGKEEVCDTDCFVKASDVERAVFIANTEKHYKGKYNPDTLRVEPAKPKCPFKPFDKVLVRNENNQEWLPGFFHMFDGDWNHPYCIMNLHHLSDYAYKQCIPYEGNEHLLGTTDPYTEGGSE